MLQLHSTQHENVLLAVVPAAIDDLAFVCQVQSKRLGAVHLCSALCLCGTHAACLQLGGDPCASMLLLKSEYAECVDVMLKGQTGPAQSTCMCVASQCRRICLLLEISMITILYVRIYVC